MSDRPDSTEEPEGLETRQAPVPLPAPGERPDWLVGADSILEGGLEESPRPPVPTPPPSAARKLEAVPGSKPEGPKAWAGAASSVPKLTVVPKRERPTAPDSEDGLRGLGDDRLGPAGELRGASDAQPSGPKAHAFRPLDEPWYLVWGEALATNRKIQLLALGVVALVGVLVLRPRFDQPGASLGGILRHPERYEGRSVVVRGEVLESFDIGQGHVFHLRQGRDTVVVFSPSRRPRLRERVEVVGTVSTGYLDGEPRVAIFEATK